jgi:acyl dehydratase
MEIKIGDSTFIKRTFTQDDYDRFAALSGDDNPIHVDPVFALSTRFDRTVAHGMLLYSVISGVLGTRLPGPGTIQLDQELMFPGPTYTGEEMTVRLHVENIRPGEGLAEINSTITRPNGEAGCVGRTLVALPPLKESTEVRGALKFPQIPSEGTQLMGLELGQSAATVRTFTREEVAEYVDLTGDANLIYTDLDYIRRMGFSSTLLPPGLMGGMVSTLLGTELPGRGTNWLKQKFSFQAPAHPGEAITASVEVIRLRPEKDLVNLRTLCANPDGEVLCVGEALVLMKEMEG